MRMRERRSVVEARCSKGYDDDGHDAGTVGDQVCNVSTLRRRHGGVMVMEDEINAERLHFIIRGTAWQLNNLFVAGDDVVGALAGVQNGTTAKETADKVNAKRGYMHNKSKKSEKQKRKTTYIFQCRVFL